MSAISALMILVLLNPLPADSTDALYKARRAQPDGWVNVLPIPEPVPFEPFAPQKPSVGDQWGPNSRFTQEDRAWLDALLGRLIAPIRDMYLEARRVADNIERTTQNVARISDAAVKFLEITPWVVAVLAFFLGWAMRSRASPLPVTGKP